MANEFDLRIDGGVLIDGTGSAATRGDIGIRDGKIVAMGKISGKARDTIDATGRAVAPGFIDVHTHYDAQVFWDPSLSPSSRLGVTTIVGGNCGFSIAPLSGRASDTEYVMRMLARVEGIPLESLQQGVPWNWTSFDEYLAKIDGTLAINAAFMVGHSAMRRTVMGDRAVGHEASGEEIAALQNLLRQSLAAGGLGLSTTVSPTHNDGDGNPVPSRHASREEMLALAGVVGEFEGTTLEFLPNLGAAGFSEATLSLMIDMSLAAKRPLNWNALTPDSRVPHAYQAQLAASDLAAARGARVVPLVQAQVNGVWVNFVSGFVLDAYPSWDEIMRLPLAARKTALADPAVRKRLDAGAHSPQAGVRALTANWADWVFAEVFNPANKSLQGKKVGDVAKAQGKEPFDVMLDVVVADDLKTSLGFPTRGGDEESWRMRGEAWSDERTVIGASDAGAHLDLNDGFASYVQLFSVGVRQRKLLRLEEAVRQLTSLPALLVGLKGRGRLTQGYWADILVFDPETIGRGPIYTRFDLPGQAGRLYADSIGIEHVIVNGQEIVRGRQFNNKFPGKLLRSGKDTYTVSLAPAQAL